MKPVGYFLPISVITIYFLNLLDLLPSTVRSQFVKFEGFHVFMVFGWGRLYCLGKVLIFLWNRLCILGDIVFIFWIMLYLFLGWGRLHFWVRSSLFLGEVTFHFLGVVVFIFWVRSCYKTSSINFRILDKKWAIFKILPIGQLLYNTV